jgi:ATP-dependent DNA helicase RecG
MKWLKTYIPLRYEITGKKLQRDEIPELPYDALREALLNSVIHRDYFEKGAVSMVEFYDDRVHIHNPGGLVKGIRPEEFGLTSISRNPFLQGLFHRANLVERIGSGIGRMRDEMKVHGLEEPEFDWNGFFRITFKRPEKEDQEVVSVEGTANDAVSHIKSRILVLIKSGEIVRRPDVERLLHLSYATAQRHLANLVKKGLIIFEGAPKTGKYVITRNGDEFLASLMKGAKNR